MAIDDCHLGYITKSKPLLPHISIYVSIRKVVSLFLSLKP